MNNHLKIILLVCGLTLIALVCPAATYNIPTATAQTMTVSTLTIAAPIAAASYTNSFYVTQAGAGDHDGSSAANAWSVAEFNATNTPTGGDVVYFSGTISTKVLPVCNGIAAAHLHLHFTNASLAVGATATQLEFDGNSYITVYGSTLGSTQTSGQSILMGTAQSRDIVIDGFKGLGAVDSTGQFCNAGYCSNLVVRNCYVTNVGCFLYTTSFRAHHLSVSNCSILSSTNTADQTDMIQLGDANNVLIQGNFILLRAPGAEADGRHNDVLQSFKAGNADGRYPHSWTVRYNHFKLDPPYGEDNRVTFGMMEAFTNTGFGMRIYGNLFDAEFGGPDDQGIAFSPYSDDSTFEFHHNTMIFKDTPFNYVNLAGGGGACQMSNNVGYATNWTASYPGVITITLSGADSIANDFNILYYFCPPGGVDMADYVGPNGGDEINPKLVNFAAGDYRLAEDSPCIDGGAALAAEFSYGISTNATWPNPSLTQRTAGHWDIGAYQRP